MLIKQIKLFFNIYFYLKAYSVRDEEVGYCQGVSFVIATILIHVRIINICFF